MDRTEAFARIVEAICGQYLPTTTEKAPDRYRDIAEMLSNVAVATGIAIHQLEQAFATGEDPREHHQSPSS